MKKIINIVLLVSVAVAFIGCKKYLSVTPKGVVIPEKVVEYELILNSEPLTSSFPEQLLYASDDVYAPYTKVEDNPDANAYFWKSQLNNGVEASPAIWGPLYRSIYNTNIIINNVMGATDGTDVKKKQVLGEALVFRSIFYFDLATTYAKAYNPATAATDPGIPLVTSTDVTEKTPPRSSVRATFDTIITNLKSAAGYLPPTSPSNSRIDKYVAFGMLSRVYLYMQDYTNAAIYANKALEAPHELLDYNNYFGGFMLPMAEDDPQILWQRYPNDIAAIFYVNWSNQLVDTFSPSDLRMQFLALDYFGIGQYYWGGPGFGSYGISFPEIYLTLAEALVHEHKLNDAMDIVNLIRSKRISADAYELLTASDEDEALGIVLQERRWELALTGTRWMDMKRLDAQGNMPAVQRLDFATGDVLETLEPNSPRYTFEIPSRVLMFNPTMERNFK